jgi:hypothetical protein
MKNKILEIITAIYSVGDGIMAAALKNPLGNIIGLIYNPNFNII